MQRVRVTDHAWGTRIELSAPERRNALDQQAVADLLTVFRTDGPGAVLLCAEGPVFCAGGDLEVLGRAAAEGDLVDVLVSGASAFADLVEAIVACARPVVAAVDGPAVGGGVSLALACDIRLATPRARLVLAWGRHGLPPDGGATALLAATVGPSRARSLVMESADVDAESELAPYVFTRIVPADRLSAESLVTVAALADSPGARAAKAATAALLLSALRQQRDEELAVLARAAADPATGERLAMLYKIDR